MALDFPNSPANGDVYGSYVYDSSLPGWRSKGGAVAATYVSDTAPSGAVKGDMWYRSSDGTTYVYVVDVDTSQWVEIRSEVAASKVGLVPVSPTSITLGSGTGSVDAAGLVTFTNASTVTLTNCFTSTYTDYKIVISAVMTSANQDIWFRWSNSGTDVSTGYYGASIYGAYNVATPGAYGNMTNANAAPIGNFGILTNNSEILASPRNTYSALKNQAYSTSMAYYVTGGYNSTTSTRPDGFKIYTGGAGNLTGTLKVYGVN